MCSKPVPPWPLWQSHSALGTLLRLQLGHAGRADDVGFGAAEDGHLGDSQIHITVSRLVLFGGFDKKF